MGNVVNKLLIAIFGAWLIACCASAATPDFNGVWRVTAYQQQLRTLDGKAPPLLPAAAARHQATLAAFRQGDTSFDLTAHQCASPGTPRILYLPYPFEIIQTEQQITFLFEWNHLFRTAPFGRFNEYPYTTAMGASKAEWDGDALMITTNNLSESTLLDATGLPRSETLVVRERYQLAKDGQHLSVRIRFEDGATFSAPWETQLELRRLPGYKLSEDICLDRQAKGEPAIKPFTKP